MSPRDAAVTTGSAVTGADDGSLERVRELVERLAGTGRSAVRTLRVRVGAVEVELNWDPLFADRPPDGAVEPGTPIPEAGTAVAPPPGLTYVCAMTVGVFYTAPQPGAPPFVSVGDTITEGQKVGIVEAMKLMIPVEADRAGEVVEVLVANGDPVEYGQRLIAVRSEVR